MLIVCMHSEMHYKIAFLIQIQFYTWAKEHALAARKNSRRFNSIQYFCKKKIFKANSLNMNETSDDHGNRHGI